MLPGTRLLRPCLLSSPALPLFLCLSLLPAAAAGLTADDVWSGHIWDKAQRARDLHASNSDRLMQHIWQWPDQAHRFVDCDILADGQTDEHFLFLNLYDADDEREAILSELPTSGYVRGMWPLNEAGSSTVHYKMAEKVDSTLATLFRRAADRWQTAANVKFVPMKNAGGKKPENHLEVVLDGGCFTTLGYHATEPRKLSLHPDRCTLDVIVHLLGHVLGLPHPTSTVGRTKEQYLMPHHAAPRSFGVLRTRAGAPFDPFDIMAVDPWFCGVSNRTTWRPLSPNDYRWAAVTGVWNLTTVPTPEKTSMSTVLLQNEIRQKSGKSTCGETPPAGCDHLCGVMVTPNCHCVGPVEKSSMQFVGLAKNERCFLSDMGKKRIGSSTADKMSIKFNMDSPNPCVFYHSTDVTGSDKTCWQCTLFIFTLYTHGLFDSEERRLISLGSRCTLFNMEVNGALEEAWYRICLHHLLTSDEGKMTVAFRGPGSVLIRYFSSREVFPEFHRQFTSRVKVNWKIEKAELCDCSKGPEAEVQYSVDRSGVSGGG